MRFLNPAGLWLLLLVPILILVYIIRSRHEERAVSSTYIWKLSQRFMKKKLPFRKIRKILLFACQLLTIVGFSLYVAQPVIVTEGGGREYVVIIDASASMQTENTDGEARFDRAVELAAGLIGELPYETPVTLILANEDASYLVQRSKSETELRMSLGNVECGVGVSDIEGALGLAQLICDEHPVTDVILFSDREYTTAENVSVVNVAEDEESFNISVTGMTYTRASDAYTFSADVICTGESLTKSFALKVDGRILNAQSVSLVDGEMQTVTFTAEGLSAFETAEIYTEANDGLSLDNSYTVCQKTLTESKVLIVSENPFYLENVFGVMDNCIVTVAASLEEAALSGYGLYVFDGCMPETLPSDGSVWLLDPTSSPDDMSLGEAMNEDAYLSFAENTDGEAYAVLNEGLSLDEVSVSVYSYLVAGKSWEKIWNCGEDTALYARKEANGMRTVVLNFDLHDSNLPMKADFVIFIKNLLEYSLPEMLEVTDYAVGDSVSLTVLPMSELLYVQTPDDSVQSLSIAGSKSTVVADSVGVYTAVQTLSSGTSQYVDFYVHIPLSEIGTETGGVLSVTLPGADSAIAAEEGFEEIWFWIVLTLLVLILAEWGLYYYEQF